MATRVELTRHHEIVWRILHIVHPAGRSSRSRSLPYIGDIGLIAVVLLVVTLAGAPRHYGRFCFRGWFRFVSAGPR
jgi:hypothetical protein